MSSRRMARAASHPSIRAFAASLCSSSCVALALALTGCEAEKPAPAEVSTETAPEKKPAVDQKIANAMAAAQASAEPAPGSSDGQPAPPADGMMSAEAAAREVAAGAPAVVVLGSEGATPRLKLGAERLGPGAGPAGVLELSYRSGGSVMPTVQLEIRAKVSAASAAAPPGSIVTRFGLVKAQPAEQQPGRLPENARTEIAKLEGSSIELVSTPRGAVIAARHQLAGNNPDLEPLVMGSAETLSSVSLPYPEVPVGVGGFWMVKSRETTNGADVLVYRMVRVVELSGDSAKLSVSTRRYLVGESLPLQGFPPHRVRQFQSQGEATLSLKAGSAYPTSAELEDRFVAFVAPNDQPNQALPVQSETKARLTLGP